MKYLFNIQVKRLCTFRCGSQRREANVRIQFWESYRHETKHLGGERGNWEEGISLGIRHLETGPRKKNSQERVVRSRQ